MISAGGDFAIKVCTEGTEAQNIACRSAFETIEDACGEADANGVMSYGECASESMITSTDWAAPSTDQQKAFVNLLQGYSIDSEVFGYAKEAISSRSWNGKPLEAGAAAPAADAGDAAKKPDFTADINAVCKADFSCATPLTRVANAAFELTKDEAQVRYEFIKTSPAYKDDKGAVNPVYQNAGITEDEYNKIVEAQGGSAAAAGTSGEGVSLIDHGVMVSLPIGIGSATVSNDLKEPGQDDSKLGIFMMMPRLELFPLSFFKGVDTSRFNVGVGASFFYASQKAIQFENGGEVTSPAAKGFGVNVSAAYAPIDIFAVRARLGYLRLGGEFMAGMQGRTDASINNFNGELGVEVGKSFGSGFGIGAGLYGGFIVGGTNGETGDTDLIYNEAQAADWHVKGGYGMLSLNIYAF